ncbi:hypothetical protein GCM10010317_054090 [Streptomyces mirabilis]|nr:hypothetical protein GCM10010317_054090 [Streptomyces mirabilis]
MARRTIAGQIQVAVDQCASAVGGVGEEDTDLAVLRASGGAGVLALHAGRADALLEEAGVIDDQDRLAVSEVPTSSRSFRSSGATSPRI